MFHPSHPRQTALIHTRLIRTAIGDETVVSPNWIGESTFVWVRWTVVAALFLLFIMFPAGARPAAALLATILALGNIAALAQLRAADSPIRSKVLGMLGTLLEWSVALGMVAALSHDLAVASSMLTTVLLLPTIARYRFVGVALASCAAGCLVALWAGLHLAVYDLRPDVQTWRLLKQWVVALPLAAIALVLLVWSGEAQRRWTDMRRAQHRVALIRRHERERAALQEEAVKCAADLTAYRHLDCGLTAREWEVPQLLADDTLTYKQIGERLFISPATVKVHVRNIGETFGVSGRSKVLTAARERSLLSAEDTSG